MPTPFHKRSKHMVYENYAMVLLKTLFRVQMDVFREVNPDLLSISRTSSLLSVVKCH